MTKPSDLEAAKKAYDDWRAAWPTTVASMYRQRKQDHMTLLEDMMMDLAEDGMSVREIARRYGTTATRTVDRMLTRARVRRYGEIEKTEED